MKHKLLKSAALPILLAIAHIIAGCSGTHDTDIVKPAKSVLTRILGDKNAGKFELILDTTMHQTYCVTVVNNKVRITASSQVALCRGAYDYLSNACHSMVSWSGNRINIPEKLPAYSDTVRSHFKYHYYLNVVTHGYTMAYWDWPRWEKEIDWMALHGMDMPLLSGAHEAILLRVFKKLGLTQQEIDEYFTGPAYFPWNKMGNITGWDGPVPAVFYEKQVKLNHQILDRMRELGMKPIIPAFAGFVPTGIQRLYPGEKIRELSWCLFEKKYAAHILEPGSELFVKIGKMYITEWEKEFGKADFYLADSFNEMDVPLSQDSLTALKELASYGESVYRSIHEANPGATWVMQGWTFPFQKKDGKLFWTPERLQALVSKVPDDKLLILDLANEFNRLRWHIEPSWKMYEGFFGKQWIYSFIPNMGGKTPFNGRLDLYATMPFEALNYEQKKNLVGFGFAPEGTENNDIVYELIADVGYAEKAIDLNTWLQNYCLKRYGVYPESMKQAFGCFNKSCFGGFLSHPYHAWQFRPDSNGASLQLTDDFEKGVQLFLSCKDSCRGNALYETDAIEFTCQYLGLKADKLLQEFRSTGETNYPLLDEALGIVADIDKLLESHPNFKLQNWVNYARNFGSTQDEKDYYESDARRLITTWGGGELNEYAAKTWSGLIRDYYIPRWKLYYDARKRSAPFDMKAWEEQWIHSGKVSAIKPFDKPADAAYALFHEQFKKDK